MFARRLATCLVLTVALVGCGDDAAPTDRLPPDSAGEVPPGGIPRFPARVFEGTGTVRGRVLLHPSRTAAEGAVVAFDGPGRLATRVQRGGRFELVGVPAKLDAAVVLSAARDAAGSADLPPRTVRDIPVRPGRVIDIGTIWLGAPAAWTGRVTDGRGQPVAGAVVTLHAPHLAQYRAQGPVELGFHRRPPARGRVLTDADGRYRFAQVARGASIVVVRAAGYAPYLGRADLAIEETPDGRYVKDIVLAAGHLVSGTVSDKHGRPALAAAVVLLRDFTHGSSALTARFTTTDAQGRFRFRTGRDASERLFVFAGTTFFTWSEPVGAGLEVQLR